jgi:hypothetical protein
LISLGSGDGIPAVESPSAEDAVRAFLAAYNAHDIAAVAQLFADDAVYADVGAARSYEGKDQVVSYVEFAFETLPDCRWQLDSIVASGDRATFEGTFTETLPPGVALDCELRHCGPASTWRWERHRDHRLASVVGEATGVVGAATRSRLSFCHRETTWNRCRVAQIAVTEIEPASRTALSLDPSSSPTVT